MARRSRDELTQRRNVTGIRGDWWAVEDKTKLHEHITPLVRAIRDEQSGRDRANQMFYSMFIGRGSGELVGNGYAYERQTDGSIRVNFARSIAGAANSRMTANKTRILALTEGGNWQQKARAKRITKAINGTLQQIGFYEKNPEGQRDSCVWDLGSVFLDRDEDKVVCERVPGCEIRVDATDGRYGCPQQMHREKAVARTMLAAKYPQHADAIYKAKNSRTGTYTRSRFVADCVDVVYSWALGNGKTPGHKAVTIDGATLDEAEYGCNHFPFVFHRWEPNPFGFYGQSICSIVLGCQHTANEIIDDIQEHVRLSTGFVAVEAGSVVGQQAFTNEIMRVVEYANNPPQTVMPPALQPEKINWLEWVTRRAYEESGISEMAVHAQKPAGLDSGKALREFADQNSERFMAAHMRYEQTFVDAAEIVFDILEDIYSGNKKLKVSGRQGDTITSIDWAKARMDRDEFTLKIVPTNFLPSTPGAKLETVREMLEAGMLGKDEAMMLLDYPDLEKITSLQLGPVQNIERMLDIMLDPDDPKPVSVDPHLNIELAMKLGAQAYNDAQLGGAPDANLQYVRDWLSELVAIQEQQTAPPPAQAMPEMAPPQQPMPPDMGAMMGLPNVGPIAAA